MQPEKEDDHESVTNASEYTHEEKLSQSMIKKLMDNQSKQASNVFVHGEDVADVTSGKDEPRSQV